MHWEGTLSPNTLVEELTKYNVDLVFLNVNTTNRMFLSSTFPNKVFEYLGAGLPLAIEDLPILKKFVRETGTGEIIDFTKDIKKQIEGVKEIKIDKNILEKNGFLMEHHSSRLIEFYNKVYEFSKKGDYAYN